MTVPPPLAVLRERPLLRVAGGETAEVAAESQLGTRSDILMYKREQLKH
jgi:hypothetical protein